MRLRGRAVDLDCAAAVGLCKYSQDLSSGVQTPLRDVSLGRLFCHFFLFNTTVMTINQNTFIP